VKLSEQSVGQVKYRRTGESGADGFTIMRLMGHSTVALSQRYVHPSPEARELAYERSQ